MIVDSPIGKLLIRASDRGVSEIRFKGQRGAGAADLVASPLARDAAKQLAEYFRGERRAFDVPLDFGDAPEFFRTVWQRLCEIPFGSTVAYGDIAAELDKPLASRAVGRATGSNPVPIVVPCHRVIGKDGSLTGFGGGMERKRWLLRHEGVLLA